MVQAAIITPKKNLYKGFISSPIQGNASRTVRSEFKMDWLPDILNRNGYVYLTLKANMTYTISFKATSQTIGNGQMGVFNNDASVQLASYTNSNFSFNTGNNTLVRMYLRNSLAIETVTFENIQVEEGAAATQFEPYIPLNTAATTTNAAARTPKKNLFDGKLESGSYNTGDGTLLANATYVRNANKYIPVTPSTTYILTESTPNLNKNIYYYDINKNFISYFNYSNSGLTFTTPANCAYINFRLQATDVTITTQIEKGSTATAYEPYIPLNTPAILQPSAFSFVVDFVGKVAGSTVENPNIIKQTGSSSLQAPAGITSEILTTSYAKINSLDGNAYNVSVGTNGGIIQQLFSFDIISNLERNLGISIWQGKTLLSEKIVIAKSIISTIKADWWGFGSSVGGNGSTFSKWWGSWVGAISHSNGTISKLTVSETNMSGFIDVNGFVHFLAYTNNPSDGTTASVINTDYISLTLTGSIPNGGKNTPAI
jgi:hypothetical protein